MKEWIVKNKRIVILFGLAAFFFLFGLICFWIVAGMKIENCIVVGNEMYSQEEIASLIFENEEDAGLIHTILAVRKKEQKKIPYVAKYDMEIVGLHTVKITVYEKKIVGCFLYMSRYMYFDRDGYVVESTGEQRENVPLIEGFEFDRIVLNEKLPVENDDIFNKILNHVQLVDRYDIPVRTISYDRDENVTLFLSKPKTVRVYLGESENMEKKLGVLKDILPKMEGMSGVLYMNTENDFADRQSYTFKED